MIKQKLKIGLLLNQYNVPHWTYKMIENIQNSSHSEIVLVVKKEQNSIKKTSIFNQFWSQKNHVFYNLYSKFEQKLFKTDFNAFALNDLKKIVNCSEIIVKPIEVQNNEALTADDIKKIKTQSVDVFIKIGFNTLTGEILKTPKYGVWDYHHGNFKISKDTLVGVWEVFKQTYETVVTLRILSGHPDQSTIISKTIYNTDHLFVNRNRNNLFWNSKSILPRKLKELYLVGEEQFFGKLKKQNNEPFFYDNKRYTIPTNYETLKNVFKLYWISVKRIIKERFYFAQWIVLFKLESNKQMSKSFFQFKRLLPPKDRFWADPFIIEKNNKFYIYIEELFYSDNKGKISLIEMDQEGNYTNPEIVLETDYHLSYPFLIEDNNELYMIPETEENRTIELYKCIAFPKKWELEKVLLSDLKAVDSTIFKHNNKYWLFTNIHEFQGNPGIDELFLFYSETLLENNWISHPQNPIASNPSFTRPAGNIFIKENRIFRPAQNCSKHYGYGMQIREIVTINETEYEERQVQSIYPNWEKDLLSTHTLNHSGKLTVIDANISRRK
ncbi:MAG: hypothetical protein R2816_08140 [Flavobacteriaceae bacterium]|nr:hypothetical protein [Flavobacteriaceae bacterium]